MRGWSGCGRRSGDGNRGVWAPPQRPAPRRVPSGAGGHVPAGGAQRTGVPAAGLEGGEMEGGEARLGEGGGWVRRPHILGDLEAAGAECGQLLVADTRTAGEYTISTAGQRP